MPIKITLIAFSASDVDKEGNVNGLTAKYETISKALTTVEFLRDCKEGLAALNDSALRLKEGLPVPEAQPRVGKAGKPKGGKPTGSV